MSELASRALGAIGLVIAGIALVCAMSDANPQQREFVPLVRTSPHAICDSWSCSMQGANDEVQSVDLEKSKPHDARRLHVDKITREGCVFVTYEHLRKDLPSVYKNAYGDPGDGEFFCPR